MEEQVNILLKPMGCEEIKLPVLCGAGSISHQERNKRSGFSFRYILAAQPDAAMATAF
jgi:hypothetical protein